MKIDIALQDLKNRLDFVNRIIEYSDKRLKDLPDGNLRIQHQGNSLTYYCARESPGDVNGRIITDRKLIKDLAQKSYLRKVRQSAMEEQKAIRQMLKNYPELQLENIYGGLRDDRKELIKPVAWSDEEYAKQWLAQPYQRKPFRETDPNYRTLKGERVRSKAEAMMADRLNHYNIPYKYECPILVCGEIYHPDFTILRKRDRQILYWEHCGLMDKEDYADSTVLRFNKYSKEGIILGKNLFATFETGRYPLDTETADRLINAHFI